MYIWVHSVKACLMSESVFPFRTSHQDVLKSIAAEGKLSEETDAKLKKIVQEFIATFQG